ncbi:MAG: UbiH/UbiF family hydroxylase [Pseudomonadota bacterium]|nr:UbiH/UbiF family hydroxylase [Pseudomonadota bacterium]
MSRRQGVDAIVVGGGVVGAACALALARNGLEVALVEAAAPKPWRREQPDLRVYAFAADNAALLDALGVWDAVRSARLHPYRRMRVWDAAGGGELAFDADAFGRRELGWIVENGLLVDRLWAALPAAGVRVHCPARVVALESGGGSGDDGEDLARLRLDDGSQLQARVAIAADGAQSTLRELAGLQVRGHDYGQRGVVGYVATESSHEDTAWQRFLPTGPLAMLPCADGSSSIVWTLPDAEATRILSLDDEAFADELTRASDARLGQMRPVSARAAFPLRRQLVQSHVRGRVLVLGDAAHVVHPLAGQGVNLGLRDVAALESMVAGAGRARGDWATPSRLARWARERRSENMLAAHAFEGINRIYSNDSLAATLLRGPLLGLAGRLPPVAHFLWKRAAGL